MVKLILNNKNSKFNNKIINNNKQMNLLKSKILNKTYQIVK
jgi:hypothetical protein